MIFILGECFSHTDVDFCETILINLAFAFYLAGKKGFKTCIERDIMKTCPENGKI